MPAKSFLICLLTVVSGLTAWAWWSDVPRSASRTAPPALQFQPFRYPGPKSQAAPASTSAAPAKSIRVGLAQDRRDLIMLAVDCDYTVRRAGESRVLESSPRLSATRVVATRKGIRIGDREFSETKLDVVPATSPAVWVNRHQYRGTVRIVKQAGNAVLAVNVLPLDEYLASVVDSEMPLEFGETARKAQAVVARTYAMYQMQQAGAGSPYDLHASTRSQKYLGFQYRADDGRMLAGESSESRRLVEATRGQVLTYRGSLFCTYYSAVCGGRTLNGSELFADAAPPVRSVACSWCLAAKNHRWSVELSKAAFAGVVEQFFRDDGASFGKLRSVRSTGINDPGGLPTFEFSGDRGLLRVRGDVVRRMFAKHGVLSPRLTLTERKSTWLLAGTGHGHGSGMCQWGARGMGQSGMSDRQILMHYYPGAEITQLSSGGRK